MSSYTYGYVYNIGQGYQVYFESGVFAGGYHHRCRVMRHGVQLAKKVINWINRSWESYEFECVYLDAKEKLSKEDKEFLSKNFKFEESSGHITEFDRVYLYR